MHPANMGTILYKEPMLPPCTAAAAQQLIVETGMDLRGAETVVVGHSEIVGKPIAVLLLHHLSTVTVCHIGTKNLIEHTRRADIVVVAVGKAGLVHGDMLKPGACVIDVGINQGPDGKIVGDVDFKSANAGGRFLDPGTWRCWPSDRRDAAAQYAARGWRGDLTRRGRVRRPVTICLRSPSPRLHSMLRAHLTECEAQVLTRRMACPSRIDSLPGNSIAGQLSRTGPAKPAETTQA